MAAAALTRARRSAAAGATRRELPAWARCYALAWTITAAAALLVAATPGLAALARRALGLSLRPHPASLAEVVALFAHNLPLIAWPLLLPRLRLASRWARAAASALVLGALALDSALVGTALGAYGPRLAVWLPHLPLEWAALALGTASGVAPDTAPTARPARRLAAIATLLFAAAALETYATPQA